MNTTYLNLEETISLINEILEATESTVGAEEAYTAGMNILDNASIGPNVYSMIHRVLEEGSHPAENLSLLTTRPLAIESVIASDNSNL